MYNTEKSQMNKLLRNVTIIAITLGLIAFAASYYIKKQTKKNSPQSIAELVTEQLTLKIVYCQPYKKGRTVFGTQEEGALQPYGKYWRLGANEATTIETNRDLVFGNYTLKKGIYSIYAVPDKTTWKFGFNKDANRWGASEPDYAKNLFIVEAPVLKTDEALEQFNITVTKNEITFRWDTTKVILPYKVAN